MMNLKIRAFFLPLVIGVSCTAPVSQSHDRNAPITIAHTTQTSTLELPEGSNFNCAVEDREGTIWFGTNNTGLFRFNGEAFTHFTTDQGLSDNHVQCILLADDGKVWIGTAAGLSCYDGHAFTNTPLPYTDTSSTWLDKVYPVVNPNGARSMVQARDGTFWIGSNGAGAYHFDPSKEGEDQRFTSHLADRGHIQEDSLHHNVISQVVEDLDGNLWFTSMTHGGVSCYDGSSWRHFSTKDGLSDDMYLSACVDSEGGIWFGALGNRNGALDWVDPRAADLEAGIRFTRFSTEDGLDNNNVLSILEDDNGRMWFGSHRGRLSIRDSSGFRLFESQAGDSFYRVFMLVEDRLGHIWFSTFEGDLYRWVEGTVEQVVQG